MPSRNSSPSQEARYRAVIDTAVDSIILIEEAGYIVSFNPAAERTFGYSADEVIGKNISMLMDEPYRSAHDGYLARYLHTGERRIIGIGREVEARRKDGSTFPIELSVAEWFSGETRFFTGIVRDISEQKALREDLERERALLTSIVEHLPTGLLIAEAPTGRILSQNKAADRLLGSSRISAEDVQEYDKFESEWLDGTRLQSHDHPLVRAIRHGEEIEQEEIVFTRPDGRKVTLLCNAGPVRGADGAIALAVSTFIDISERRELEAQVEHLARHDPLTGLANRVLFADRLEQAVARTEDRNKFAALLLIDLDRFKSVNDTMGHLAGDALLREVANRITVAIRPGDTAARIGGDEFAVVLNGASSPNAIRAAADRIAATVMQPAAIGSHMIEVSASVGYAVCPPHVSETESLLHYADLALYEAKTGYERVREFDRSMAEEADRKAKIEGELRRALDAGELFLHYQPQIELATQRVSAVEALVRWMRNGIAVPPVEFISLAESSGTIHDLGKWVIETACHQQAQWRRQGYDFKIGINVSPLQASTPDFISIVDRALERSGIEGRSVEFEITEGMLFNPESPSVAAFLGACRTRRIDLAVDDFGVGYSSLGYLARLPIAKVKIDRSFVSRVGASSDETVLGAMIDLGQKLGKRVVAEGVETDAQCAYLRSSGDLDAQGYFFAPPQLAETLDVWLRTAA